MREDDKRRLPRIVCLCGSTRFRDEFVRENFRLSLAGQIVLTVGVFTHANPTDEITREQKAVLDVLHFRKIDLCEYVYVLNVGGYIGESTEREIAYAHSVGRPVCYLEKTDDRA